jgi:hypothetical protein
MKRAIVCYLPEISLAFTGPCTLEASHLLLIFTFYDVCASIESVLLKYTSTSCGEGCMCRSKQKKQTIYCLVLT